MTDPAGIFPSDVHRHIIAHLSHPEDDYGWTADGLVQRTRFDPVLWFTEAREIEPYLHELAEVGDIHQIGEAWKMTPQGFNKLNGPIADEPGPQERPAQPALVVADMTLTPQAAGRVDLEPQPKPQPKKRRFGRTR